MNSILSMLTGRELISIEVFSLNLPKKKKNTYISLENGYKRINWNINMRVDKLLSNK